MSEILRDGATGLLNDAYFRAALPNRVATARRVLRPVSVAVLTAEGEGSVASVAYGLLDTLRDCDTACRLDDGRFGLLLEDTPEDGALYTLQRLRQLLIDQAAPVTVWGGIASYPVHALEPGTLLLMAELALQQAREWPDGRFEVAAGA